jgi:branched-chain amino acid transport system ATP-binding protein
MSDPKADQAAPALTVEHLDAWYGAAQVLYDVNFSVARGEVVALMGRNGAGKSTTMKAVMGLIARRRGAVRFNGRDVAALKSFEIARLGLGYTPEDRRIFAELTVEENLDTGRQPPRTFPDGTAAPEWTPESLYELFPNLAELRHRPGGRMSGGEQQMLTIARTLMGNPLLVLLDEPSEGIAPVIVEKIADTIVELKQRGLSILLSEQNVGFARIVSDRTYLLEKGQIRWSGTMAELAENEDVQRNYLAL